MQSGVPVVLPSKTPLTMRKASCSRRAVPVFPAGRCGRRLRWRFQGDRAVFTCAGPGFTAEETDRALTLYGMAPLYAKLRRDAVFLSALGAGVRDVHEVDRLLRENGEAPLYACK